MNKISAKELNKSQSTIGKEIKNNRKRRYCPLIKQGQSIYTILQNHTKITQCAKTIYTYIEMGLFKDWGITSLDLRKKVTRKLSKKKLKKEQNLLTILVESTKTICNS